MSKIVNIAIIGLGPRGLVVLERLAALLPTSNKTYRFKIHIFEKNELGEGVHTAKQPDYLLLNTISSQISMYADETVTNAGSICQGETFYDWLVMQDISQEVDPNAYLPRAVLGRYLADVTKKLIKKLRRFHSVIIYPEIATDMRRVNAQQYQIYMGNKLAVTVDYIYITTGHSTNNPTERDAVFQAAVQKHKKQNTKLAYLFNPYPIADIPTKISAGTTVAIEGLGLAALDVLTALTIGKQGRYTVDKGELVYHKSGNEPAIIMYSLDGLPLSGRAYNKKNKHYHYQPKFFTFEKIAWLRKHKGIGSNQQLDFEADIFPELKKEIDYHYCTIWLKTNVDQRAADKFNEAFIHASACNYPLAPLINQYIPVEEQLNWQSFLDPFANKAFTNLQQYKAWLIKFLEWDLAECYRGNLSSPYKAACDILRDMRDILRYAIEFSGLTPASHKIFVEKFMPFINRVSIGPPKERVAEMIALIKAGVLDIFVGPLPAVDFDDGLAKFKISGNSIKNNIARYADVIIKARVPAAIPTADRSPFMQNCIQRGLLTAYQNGDFTPGGIAIDKRLHPIDQYQQVQQAIWAMGPVVEGAKFYTFVLPAPGNNSVVFRDANTAVLEMLSAILPVLNFNNNNINNEAANNEMSFNHSLQPK